MKQDALKQIRESVGLTQEQLAEKMKVSQSDISRIENRKDLKISTIKKYVIACGGEIELNVRTNGNSVSLF